jgi:predicted DNA-binding transcriptional regulator
MNSEYAKALWKEICYLLSDSIKSGISERDFELQVVRAIEKLGWSEFLGEIIKQPSIKFGRQALRPDLVVYDSKKRALMAIEVKRPAENLSNDHIDGQLKSYMLQLKTNFGLVIGDSVKLFYDGPEKNSIINEPLLLKEISFDPSFLADGLDFVTCINKDSLLNGGYESYIEKLIERVRAKRNITELKELLLSFETKEKIRDFLKREYSEFGADIVDQAIDSVSIQLSIGEIREPFTKPPSIDSSAIDPGTFLDKVYSLIRERANGITKTEICEILGLKKRQISNVVYKLSRMNKVHSPQRGIYTAVNSAPKEPKSITTTSKPIDDNLAPGNLMSVYKAVCRKKNGTTVDEIELRSGLFGRQVSNALYKLQRRGLIKNLKKGSWVAVKFLHPVIPPNRIGAAAINGSLNSGSLLESIYNLIYSYKGGIEVQSIRDKLQLEDRQVSNALYKLSKKGLVESVGRGKYTAI